MQTFLIVVLCALLAAALVAAGWLYLSHHLAIKKTAAEIAEDAKKLRP